MAVPASVTGNLHGDCRRTAPGSVRVPARGSFGGGFLRMGSFDGTYTLQSFVHQYEQLAAAGVIAGRLCDSSGEEIGLASRRVTVAVTAAVTEDGVGVEVGPLDVNLSGLTTRLEPLGLHLAPHPEWGEVGEALLCAIAPPLDRPIIGDRVVCLLNALLTIIDQPERGAGTAANGE